LVFETCPVKAMQARGRPLHSFGLESFIVRWIDFDSSSKLCFEEKSNKVLYDKIFQKIAS